MMSSGAMPPLGRMMVFVDGEHLALRFKDICNRFDHELHPDLKSEEDVYVWSPSLVAPRFNVVQRATYYTSCTGDEVRIHALEASIKALIHNQYCVYNVAQPPQLRMR